MKLCKCGKEAGVTDGVFFACVDCYVETIRLAFAIRQAAGDKDIEIKGSYRIDPKPFA